MGYMSLMLVMPALVFISFAASAQIVSRRRIVNQTQALLVGAGAVPLVFAFLSYVVYFLSRPANSDLAALSAVCSLLGAMIGGWVGASVAYITNQARSGRPDLERAYRDTIAKAQRQPRRKTVNDLLKAYKLQDTRGNVWLYQSGLLLVLISFVAVMNQMSTLGLLDVRGLDHSAVSLRIAGTIAPFAVPSLLWATVRRWLPALGYGLRDGIFPLLPLYVLVYGVLNMLSAPPAR